MTNFTRIHSNSVISQGQKHQEHWMQIMKESPKLWDWVVKYGQFEPRNDEETDQQRRRRRQNTFAPELPQAFAAQHGGLAALRNRMKTLA